MLFRIFNNNNNKSIFDRNLEGKCWHFRYWLMNWIVSRILKMKKLKTVQSKRADWTVKNGSKIFYTRTGGSFRDFSFVDRKSAMSPQSLLISGQRVTYVPNFVAATSAIVDKIPYSFRLALRFSIDLTDGKSYPGV